MIKQKTIILLSLLAVVVSCKQNSKNNKISSAVVTLKSDDSINLKLIKIYNIGTLNTQDAEIKLEKDKNFTITEKLDKLVFCYAIASNGSSPFFIGPDMNRNIALKTNSEGNLKFVFDSDDYVNNFAQIFHEKLNSLFRFEGQENDFLNAVDKVKMESLHQLNEIKSKIDTSSFQILKNMIYGKMAHLKFIGSEWFKSLTPQSSYYDFVDNLDFNNDDYLIYSDNLNTLYSTLEIKYQRRYNKSFAAASDKLEFINENIKNDEVRSQMTSFILSKEIPEKTAEQKQAILTKLKTLKIKNNYYQYISELKAGTALGAKIGSQAKYLETLISENKNFDIKSLDGKTLYVDNWATWCGPCVKSMKSFLAKYNELSKADDVVFVFVSFDRNESIWRQYLKEHDFPKKNIVHLYNGSDMKSNYAKYYNVIGLPKYFVVSKSRTIANLNPSTPSDEDFEQFIKNR